MEHLPRVLDPAHPDWEVVYLNANGTHDSCWDGGDFATFPERQGWDLEKLYAGHYKLTHTDEQTSAMLQEWLYFGMLAVVLTRPINRSDFLRKNENGQDVITTVLLEDYLYDWIDVNRALPKEYQDANRIQAKKAIEITSYYINRHPSANHLSPLSGQHDDIIMSIRLLGHILGYWGSAYIWKSFQVNFLGIPTRLLAGKMVEPEPMVYGFSGPDYAWTEMMVARTSSWCPYERDILSKALSVSTLFYLSNLKPIDTGKDHGRCSRDACHAYTVDPVTYETKHCDTCFESNCGFIHVPETDLVEIVQNDGLPLILMTATDTEVSISVVRWEEGMEFTAISHVWSDGLGNEDGNALPKCQFLQIAAALRANSNESGKTVKGPDDVAWRKAKRPDSFKDRVDEFDRKSKLLKKRAINATLGRTQDLTAKDSLEKTEYWSNPELKRSDPFNFQSSWGSQIEKTRESRVESSMEVAENRKSETEDLVSAMRADRDAYYASAEHERWLQQVEPEVEDSDTAEPASPNPRSTDSAKSLLFWMDTICIPNLPKNHPLRKTLRKKAITEMTDVYDQAESVMVFDTLIRKVSLEDSETERMGRIMMSGWMRRLWTYQEGLLARSLQFRVADGVIDFFSASFFAKIVGNIVLQDIFQNFPAGDTSVLSKPDRFIMWTKIVTTLKWRSLSKPGDEVLVLCLLLRMSRGEIEQVMGLPREERMQQFWSMQSRIPRGVLVWQGPRLKTDGFKWAPSTLLTPQRNWREQPPYTAARVTPHGLHSKYMGWVFTKDQSLERTFYMWDKTKSTLYNIYPADDEQEPIKWIQGARGKPQTYGIVVLSPVPDQRYTYGALLSVYKRERGAYYTNYMCQVNVEKAKGGDFFSHLRLRRALGSGAVPTTMAEGLQRFGAVTENDEIEPDWYIG